MCQQGSGLLGTHCLHVCVHPKCGVFPRAPSPQLSLGGPLAPSLEGVMCQHSPDKDSDSCDETCRVL